VRWQGQAQGQAQISKQAQAQITNSAQERTLLLKKWRRMRCRVLFVHLTRSHRKIIFRISGRQEQILIRLRFAFMMRLFLRYGSWDSLRLPLAEKICLSGFCRSIRLHGSTPLV
jgi:hypothetical protein